MSREASTKSYKPEKLDHRVCAGDGLVFKDQLGFYRLRAARQRA
jgi:hypothetical protein